MSGRQRRVVVGPALARLGREDAVHELRLDADERARGGEVDHDEHRDAERQQPDHRPRPVEQEHEHRPDGRDGARLADRRDRPGEDQADRQDVQELHPQRRRLHRADDARTAAPSRTSPPSRSACDVGPVMSSRPNCGSRRRRRDADRCSGAARRSTRTRASRRSGTPRRPRSRSARRIRPSAPAKRQHLVRAHGGPRTNWNKIHSEPSSSSFLNASVSWSSVASGLGVREHADQRCAARGARNAQSISVGGRAARRCGPRTTR